jgi:putative DNA primase/helicase
MRHNRSVLARNNSRHIGLNNERFDINWNAELQAYVMEGQWNSMRLGPPPLHTGCRAPADLVARYLPDGKPAYGPNGPHSEIHKPISYLEQTNADLDELAGNKDAEAAIVSLAELNDLAYERKRKQAAAGLALSVGLLDKLVAAQRAKQAAESEPAPLYEHWNVEAWPEAVDGGVLLRALTERIRRHVIMTTDQVVAVALWIMLTWVHKEAAVHSPILLATSAEANSGKSTLLGIAGFLVRRSLLSVSISGPALFRSIEKWCPTFVIDEADTALVSNEDLKEVINSGWTRGQSVIRCDPETNDPRPYSTFCPKAIGLKGRRLPDTTLSRAIIIEMKRKLPDETVTDFDHLDDDGLARLRQQLRRWADDNSAVLAKAAPEIPHGFHSRVRANWKPLLAIAENAGDKWKRAAWQAAGAIEKVRATFGASIGVQLLYSIMGLFEANHVDCITSQQMVAYLTADSEGPWAEYRHGRPLSQKQLANLLNEYGIYSETVHPVGLPHAKGYRLDQFSEAFGRYLTPPSDPPVEKPTSEPCNRANDCGTGTSDENRTVQTHSAHGSEKSNFSYSHAELHGCTVRKAGNGGGAGDVRRCAQCDGTPDGKERRYPRGDREVWLHPECEPFWAEGNGWGVRR